MGERISFATTQWKDKPGKPDCMTQAEWDAMNSSKFNGLPFASPILTGFLDVGATFDEKLTNLENSLNSVTLPYLGPEPDQAYGGDCHVNDNWGLQLSPLVSGFLTSITGSKYVESPLPCDKMQYQLWNGQYYQYNRNVEKKYEGSETCTVSPGAEDPREKTVFFRCVAQGGVMFKIPSNSTTEITPVCGPGTSAIEISKTLAADLVWRLKELELDSSTFSLATSIQGTAPGSIVQDTFQSSFTFKTDQKTPGQFALSGYNESEIISQKWEKSPDDRFRITGNILSAACTGSYYGDNQTSCNNTITNASIGGSSLLSYDSSAYNYSANVRAPSSRAIELELLPFAERQEAIISIQDGSQTKYFLDFNKLISIKSANDSFGYWWSNQGDDYTNSNSRIAFGYIESNIGLPKKGSYPPAIFGWRGHNTARHGHSPAAPSFPVAEMLACATESRTFGFNHVDVTINLLGTNVTVPLSVEYSKGCGSYINQTTTTAGAIKIKGKSYYEYANSAGEAVYDKDTGAQLKDPLS